MKIHFTKEEGYELMRYALINNPDASGLLSHAGINRSEEVKIIFSVGSEKNFMVVEKDEKSETTEQSPVYH